MKINFTVNTDPIAQARPRVGKFGTYEPKRCTAYKWMIANAARKVMRDKTPFAGAIRIEIKVFRKFKPTSRTFGDWDNQGKAPCDAMNGIVYVDDSQIIAAQVFKFQDKSHPRVEIMVTDEF